jgi:hypothetical protein
LNYAYPTEFKAEVLQLFTMYHYASPCLLTTLPWELVFVIIEQLAELHKDDIKIEPASLVRPPTSDTSDAGGAHGNDAM